MENFIDTLAKINFFQLIQIISIIAARQAYCSNGVLLLPGSQPFWERL
jgi:hypothetical protein